MTHLFRDRIDAGRRIAERLSEYAGRDDVVVLGLPRGGVPVAFEIAKKLDAPLDVYIVRKLGVPGREELAMGAVAPEGRRILNRDVVRSLGVSEDDIAQVEERERAELQRREQQYRGDRERLPLKDKIVILVDDGLATGASMKVAVRAVRMDDPKEVIVAVGTAPTITVLEMKPDPDIDRLIAVIMPEVFFGVGGSYRDFSQTTDEEVIECLNKARKKR